MDASRLRPLRVGEVLDAAINIYRGRWQELTRVVAVIVVPLAVVNVIVTLSASTSLDSSSSTTTTFGGTSFNTTSTTQFDASDFWTFVAGVLVVGVISWLGTQLATAACFEIVSGTYLDQSPTWRESLAAAWSRLGSLVWLQLVYGVLLVLALLPCGIPFVYFYVAWTLAVPVLLFENVRGRKTLKRSRELLKGRWWPTAGVLLLVFMLNGVLGTAIRGVLLGVVSSTNNELIDAVASSLANAASSILTTPFAAAVITVLYYDALVRKEGFDLQRMAVGFGVDPSEAPLLDRPPTLPADDAVPHADSGDEPPFWPPPPGWKPRE